MLIAQRSQIFKYIKSNFSLRDNTTIKIGGEARYFFYIHSIEGLSEIVHELGDYFYLLGKGSNLLVKDNLIDKPVLKLGKEFSYIKDLGQDRLEVGAATPLAYFLNYSLKNNLGGLENLVGIPASIGGLIAMNGSSFDREISSLLEAVDVVDKEGNILNLKRQDIQFSYRWSSLKDKIIVRSWFKLERVQDLHNKIKVFFKERLSRQDFSFPSSGCIFKNHPCFPAGFLIESCECKGMCRGEAQVSYKHANFIVNLGRASYDDVDYLISVIKEKVYKKYGIILEEEIERWG